MFVRDVPIYSGINGVRVGRESGAEGSFTMGPDGTQLSGKSPRVSTKDTCMFPGTKQCLLDLVCLCSTILFLWL